MSATVRPHRPSAPVPVPGAAPRLAERLIGWQRQHGRHALPWQGSDPYRVWLSEVMLQQTQVSTVRDYFERFTARFPDIVTLAAAPLDDVLAAWSGLGYYSRARNLHRCAQVLVAEHGGRFPSRAAELVQLPGIGRSTAAAIAVFCFGERAAILDGNVKRVLTRVLGNANDLSVAAHERALWLQAEALLPEHDIARYTQGLMDLGATLCTPRKPACLLCPWQATCVARAEGRPEHYPVKTRKLKRGQRAHALLWLVRRGPAADHVWLVQRPATGVWAGLWSLPEFESVDALRAAAVDWPGQGEALTTLAHALTHFDWAMTPWRLVLPAALSAARRARLEAALPEGRWFSLDAALKLGLPAPVRKLLQPR